MSAAAETSSSRPAAGATSGTAAPGGPAGGFARIVVAYDGSDRAEDALALALRLCAPESAVLTLASVRVRARPWSHGHAGDPLPGPDAVTDGTETMLADARHLVPPGIRVRVRELVSGSPSRAITELAAAEEADLVVVGSSSHARDGTVATERTAGRLLHGAPCAVAIPPAGARDRGPFRHVGVAFDGSPESHAAVAAAYALAARDGAAVTVVRALPEVAPAELGGSAVEREQRRRRLRAQEELEAVAEAAPAGVNPRTVLAHGVPQDVIRATCAGVTDLLITGSRGYGPLKCAFVGSVSETLVEGAPHPVVVVARAPEA
jgi:nucleotide-binding universal stress UspA family protein